MTVYLTTFFDGEYDEHYTIGAFSTLQKALDAFNDFMRDYPLELIEETDDSIFTTRTYIDKKHTNTIYRFEVRKVIVDSIL